MIEVDACSCLWLLSHSEKSLNFSKLERIFKQHAAVAVNVKKLQHLEFAGFVNQQFRVFFRKALRDLQGCPEGGDLVDLVDAIH